jgi:opacity protein-like surface antigen
MKTGTLAGFVASIVALSIATGASITAAQDNGIVPGGGEISILGGVQALNENDTALPDNLLSIPAVATLTYNLTPAFALEGEFTWMIPVKQNVELETGVSQDLRTPDILAYQANLRANLPLTGPVTPYLVGGAGAVTFLSNTDSDRVPQLDESQTVFAINFGTGLTYAFTPNWALRGDVRAFVAFPSEDTPGLSDADQADEIWMERGALGFSYRF